MARFKPVSREAISISVSSNSPELSAQVVALLATFLQFHNYNTQIILTRHGGDAENSQTEIDEILRCNLGEIVTALADKEFVLTDAPVVDSDVLCRTCLVGQLAQVDEALLGAAEGGSRSADKSVSQQKLEFCAAVLRQSGLSPAEVTRANEIINQDPMFMEDEEEAASALVAREQQLHAYLLECGRPTDITLTPARHEATGLYTLFPASQANYNAATDDDDDDDDWNSDDDED